MTPTGVIINVYDAVVFVCPVRGGTLPLLTGRYLEQIPSLQGKQVAYYLSGQGTVN